MLAPHAAADVAGYKVFVSGKSGVGKTALVAKLAGLEVPLVHHETTGDPSSSSSSGPPKAKDAPVSLKARAGVPG